MKWILEEEREGDLKWVWEKCGKGNFQIIFMIGKIGNLKEGNINFK